MPKWAYHGTAQKHALSVQREGLRPSISAGVIEYLQTALEEVEAEGDEESAQYFRRKLAALKPAVFFADTMEEAGEYGGLKFRFPWPRKAKNAENEFGTYGFFIETAVAPNELEVWIPKKGAWVPLNEVVFTRKVKR